MIDKRTQRWVLDKEMIYQERGLHYM